MGIISTKIFTWENKGITEPHPYLILKIEKIGEGGGGGGW